MWVEMRCWSLSTRLMKNYFIFYFFSWACQWEFVLTAHRFSYWGSEDYYWGAIKQECGICNCGWDKGKSYIVIIPVCSNCGGGRDQVVKGAGVVILRSGLQGLHSATSGICFSVVLSSNPRSRFVNSQLVCLLPVGIFSYVMLIWCSEKLAHLSYL